LHNLSKFYCVVVGVKLTCHDQKLKSGDEPFIFSQSGYTDVTTHNAKWA
jgi:hypothetical protein